MRTAKFGSCKEMIFHYIPREPEKEKSDLKGKAKIRAHEFNKKVKIVATSNTALTLTNWI